MIKINNISFNYKGGITMNFPSFEVEKGGSALLLGQSGCGKTTLLHLMSGLLTASDGSVSIDGKDLAGLSNAELDKFRGENIGIVFQKPHFVGALSVIENIMLAQNLAGKKIDKGLALERLNKLNVGHKAKSKVTDLSEGEKQRVSIARALVNNPAVILADEPTSALDDVNCNAVIEMLQEVSKEAGSTLLVVTHDNRLKDKFSNTIQL